MATDIDTATDALAKQARQLETLDRLAQRFGQSLSGALTGGTSSGRALSGVLDGLLASLGSKLATSIGTELTTALQRASRDLATGASIGSFGGDAFPFAKGGVLSGGAVMPFAQGGVVSAPTYFPLRSGVGLMGERGAEAIMPLARGPDGRLGVRGGGGGTTQVTVNIAAQDVDSFKRSEAQVSAALARAVGRGRRAL